MIEMAFVQHIEPELLISQPRRTDPLGRLGTTRVRILPVFRKVDTFDYRPDTRLSIEETEGAGPLPALPHTFHGRLKASGFHLSLPFRHGIVLAVESEMLYTLFIVSLQRIMGR